MVCTHASPQNFTANAPSMLKSSSDFIPIRPLIGTYANKTIDPELDCVRLKIGNSSLPSRQFGFFPNRIISAWALIPLFFSIHYRGLRSRTGELRHDKR